MANDGQQEINTLFKSYDAVVKTYATAAQLLIKALESAHSDPVTKQLAKELKNGNAYQVPTGTPDRAFELEKQLKEQGVKYAMGVNVGGQGYIVIPTYEMQKAEPIISSYMQDKSRGGAVSAVDLNAYSEDKVKVIENIDQDTAMMMEYHCRKTDTPVFIKGPEDGKWNVFFAAKDIDRMDQIRTDVALDMTGRHGELVREQMQWRNNYQCSILNTALQGKDQEGNEIKSGSMIIDREGRSIEFTRNNIICKDGNTTFNVSRCLNENKMKQKILPVFAKMKDPVLLSSEERKAYERTTDKKDFLIDKEREKGRPVLSKADAQEIARTERRRVLIQEKLSQSHSSNVKETLDPYNIDQDLWGYKNSERKNFEIEHDAAQMGVSDAVILDDAEARDNGVMETVEDAVEEAKDEMEPMDSEIPLTATIIEDNILDGRFTSEADLDVNMGRDVSTLQDDITRFDLSQDFN